MPATESDRLEMHLKLRAVLGDKVADTVMEHLPPAGWSDVARQSEMVARFDTMETRFDAMETRFIAMETRFDAMETRFDAMETRFDAMETRFVAIDKRFDSLESRLNGVIAGMWAMGSIFSASILAMFAIIITKL